MSVKTKLARKAVKTTAKHTAHGATSKLARKPFRSVTLLALGALLGGIVGWRIGRSGGDDPYVATGPTSVVTDTTQTSNNSTEHASETGAVS
jgi:membrane protein YqaA with SNARE-associated domain